MVTNYRDRRAAPRGRARSTPTAAEALGSSLAVQIPVQVRPRRGPLPCPRLTLRQGEPSYFDYTRLSLNAPWLVAHGRTARALHVNACFRQIGADRLID